MTGHTGPNLGNIWGYDLHEDGWDVGYNDLAARTDTLIYLAVTSITNTPPGSPANGDRYICDTSPTGAWSGHAKAVATWTTIGTPRWLFFTPKTRWRAYNTATGGYYFFDGTNWGAEPTSLPVTLTSAADGDFLVRVGGVWVNQRPKYTIGISTSGLMLASPRMTVYHGVPKAITFPVNFGSYLGLASQSGGSANATASTLVTIAKAVAASPLTFTQIGTITIAAGTTTPTFATTSGLVQNCAQGDIIRFRGPVSPDATLTDFFATLIAFET